MSRYNRLMAESSLAGIAAAVMMPMLVALPAHGEDDKDKGLDEITVTARHSSENLQNTPVAITAMTGEMMEAQGVSGIGDLSRSAPNVTLEQNTAGMGKSALAFIRGVGQYDFLPAFEPGVGFYVNDVYQGTLFGSLVDLSDIDHVEILRGPQGTLFGKSNEGGAVRIFTPTAKGDNSGYVEAGYGSYNRQLFKGSMDLAIVPDKLFLRLSGGSNAYDGYVDQIDFACANPSEAGTLPRTKLPNQGGNCKVGTLGGDSAQVLNADLRWFASDSLVVDFRADFTNDKGQSGAETLLAVNPAANTVALAKADGVPYDRRFITGNPYTTYTTFTDPNNGTTFPNVNNIESYGFSGTIDWDATADIHVRSISAYRAYDGEFSEIWGNAPVQIDDNYFKPHHDQISEEIEVSGKLFSDKLDWTVGGFYYSALTQLNDFIYLPSVNFAFYGTDPVVDGDRSGFVHGIYHITDKLSFEQGVRWTDESKKYTFDRLVPTAAGQPQQYLPGFDPNLSVRSSMHRFDYRSALQYQWTPDLMTYAQFSTGFKGAGVNPRPSSAADVHPFAAEDLKSYEIGAKSQFFDNRLRLNTAAYLSDYTNLQLSIATLEDGVPGSTVSNAGHVQIKGLEEEIQVEPMPRFIANVSAGVLQYDILALGAAAGVAGGPRVGTIAPYVPTAKFNVGAQYLIDMHDAGQITPRLDWTWQSRTFGDVSNSWLASQGAYGIVDAHLTYGSPDGKWEGRFEIKNLLDRTYYVNKFYQYDSAGNVVGQPGLPRTFFFTVKRSF